MTYIYVDSGERVKGVWGPSPRIFLEFRRQILHSGRLPVKIIHRNFFSSVLDVPRGPNFLGSWYGHGRTGRTSGAGPAYARVCTSALRHGQQERPDTTTPCPRSLKQEVSTAPPGPEGRNS